MHSHRGRRRAPRSFIHGLRTFASVVSFTVLLTGTWTAGRLAGSDLDLSREVVMTAPAAVITAKPVIVEESDDVDTYTRDIAMAPDPAPYVPPPPPEPEPIPEPPKPEPIPEPPKPAPVIVKVAPIVVPEVARHSYSGLGVKPHVQEVAEIVGNKFGVKRILGYRASAIDREGHPAGLALDFMVGRETGDKLAEHLRANTGTYGIKYIIYRQRIALPGKEWRGMKDRGGATANHMDHVHISLQR